MFDKKNPAEQTVAESMAAIMDDLAAIREAVAGYRTNLEADGWSPTMAEALAARLHVSLIDKIFAS